MATRDYTLGKGKVLFRPEGIDLQYNDLGNAPAFNINTNLETLEHFSSREGISKKDLEVITQFGVGGSFTLDEPNSENLRMFLLGDAVTTTAQSSQTVAAIDTISIPATGDVLGKWYRLYDGGTRVYDLDMTGGSATSGGAAVDEGIEGVGNYQLDLAAGMVYFNLDQTTPTNPIAAGDDFILTCVVNASSKDSFSGGTLTTLKGDIYFIGNPPQGRVIDIMGFVSLTASGDLALIGEDWMQVQFNVEFLEVVGVDGLIHYEDRGKVGI